MIITSRTPVLDLHGEISSMVEVLLNQFIKDNIKMRNSVILVVHGKSSNILRNEVHRVLKTNKKVKQFKIDNWNLGQTIIELYV